MDLKFQCDEQANVDYFLQNSTAQLDFTIEGYVHYWTVIEKLQKRIATNICVTDRCRKITGTYSKINIRKISLDSMWLLATYRQGIIVVRCWDT